MVFTPSPPYQACPPPPFPIRHFSGVSQSVKSHVHCMFPLFPCWAFVIKWPARRWEFVIVDFHVFVLALLKGIKEHS